MEQLLKPTRAVELRVKIPEDWDTSKMKFNGMMLRYSRYLIRLKTLEILLIKMKMVVSGWMVMS